MNDVFTIVPASSKPLWALVAIGGLLLGLIAVMVGFAYSARATRFELSPAGLSIQRTLYGRTVPWAKLDVAAARPVDLRSERQLQPVLRTNGVGLPGYSAGWFRLRSGEKALLFVTDRSRVVVVPTQDDYTLLLSVADPERFVASLRRFASATSP